MATKKLWSEMSKYEKCHKCLELIGDADLMIEFWTRENRRDRMWQIKYVQYKIKLRLQKLINEL